MKQNKPSLLADLLMIMFVIVFPHAARLPMFFYPVIVLAILYFYLRYTGRTFSDIGFRWRDLTWRSFAIGSLLGAVYAMLLFLFIGPFLLWITGLPPADLNDFYYIRTDINGFITLLVVACIVVIPYEEIIFRGFVFSTINHLLPNGKLRYWLAAIITSVIFAAYHWQEGYSAVLSIFIGSVVMFWLYRIVKFNLWYMIFYHIAFDVVTLTLIRMGYL